VGRCGFRRARDGGTEGAACLIVRGRTDNDTIKPRPSPLGEAVPARRTFGVLGVLGLAALLLVALHSPPPTSSVGSHPSAPTVSVLPSASCPGASVPTILHGMLGDEGTLVPRPTVANATVTISIEVESNQTTKYGTTLRCQESNASAVTNASGGFVLNLTLPGLSCGPTGCLSYTGPFTPTSYRVAGGHAAGYFLSSARNGSSVALDWVAALSSASTSPSQFGTVSVDAPTILSAFASTGAGTPSTANVSYAWALAGTGWVASGPSYDSTITVNGTSAGPPGTATVWVNGSFNGTPIALPPVHVYLAAVATAVGSGTIAPNALDVGVPAAVSVNATGAEGYVYTAKLTPGLGGRALSTTCQSGGASGGTVAIACGFTVAYTAPGEALPSVTVTNGYSSATLSFDAVAVANALAVSVGPNPVNAYTGTNVTVSVDVVANTGTGPFGPACLLTGDGRFLCDRSAGPSWTIPVSYTHTGNDSAIVTVADSAGTNRTVPVAVEVANRPTPPTVQLNSNSVRLGVAVTATASLTGGSLPLHFWWNSSVPRGTVATGVAGSDAIPSLTFLPGTAGSELVTLTVIDALGTVVSGAANVTVVPSVVALAASVPQANGTTPAGSPVAIDLRAVDASNQGIPGFAAAVAVHVGANCGEFWLNLSGAPVAVGANRTAELSSANWTSGTLGLTIAAATAGVCPVAFEATGVAGPLVVNLPFSVDTSDLALTAPLYVHPGSTDNATRYRIVDEFGNPDPSGYVVVLTTFGASRTVTDSPIRSGVDGPTVWVNFSATQSGSGTLTVLSESNRSLLTARIVGPPPPSGPADLDIAVLAGLVVAAAAVGWLLIDRRRRGAPSADPGPIDPDEPLRRLAEGRSHVLSRLSYDSDSDLDGVAAGFPGTPPDAAELAEWIGTLVTEGLVRPSVGPDGRPRFRLATREDRRVGPRVEVDPLALDAALARRDLDAARPEDDPAPPE